MISIQLWFNVVFMLVLYVSTSSLIDAVLDFPLVPLLRMCGACTFRPPLPVLNVKKILYFVLGDSFALTFFKYHCNSACILLIIVSPKNLLGFEMDVQHIQNDQTFWTAVFRIVVFLNWWCMSVEKRSWTKQFCCIYESYHKDYYCYMYNWDIFL
jgi:hypothetical protein